MSIKQPIIRVDIALALATALPTECAAQSKPRYAAEIHRSSHGIPHITASDMGSLGFGEGYAFAQDHLCPLADQVVKARGERARYFGAGENNRHLHSDLTIRALGPYEPAREILESMPPDERDQLEGYAAGYNHYLREVTVSGEPGWGRGQEWIFPITAQDRVAHAQSVVIASANFAEMIATAAPPGKATALATPAGLPEFAQASNGWAIGAGRSASGRGMLVANPHYPWVGSNRFWEKHLVIRGRLDVYGVGTLGAPGVSIGFNRAVAWTHPVSAGKRFTLYTLELTPGHPTRCRHDGKEREMTSKVIRVEVRQPDGSLQPVERRLYFSHHGPVLNFPTIGWAARRAVPTRATWQRGFVLLDDRRPDGPAGADGKFSLDELAAAVLGNRNLSAELMRDELVQRGQATPAVMLDGQAVDLRAAGRILSTWDGRNETGRVGAGLWREFISQYNPTDLRKAGALLAQAFNPADPVNTPHTLAPEKSSASLLKLARAVRLLGQAGIALDAPLGRVRNAESGSQPNVGPTATKA